jgi:endoglucanase
MAFRVRTATSLFAFALIGIACSKPSQEPSPAAATTSAPQPLPPPPASAGTIATTNAAPATPGKNVPAIKVNTVGYAADWRKLAIFNVEPKNAVVKDAAGKVAYTFKPEDIKSRGKDPASQDLVWQADFSALTQAGRYIVEGDGAKSDAFAIGKKLYAGALYAAQKHFYFQRCRTALAEPHAVFEGDKFTRAAPCHVHEDIGWDFKDYPDKKTKRKVEGGWHDAGNYEMYVPSTAPTAQALLMAYEAHPELFKDGDLQIPESANKIPDILDEVKWGLVWVLSLQEPRTGGFRAREAVYDWSENVPPQDERKARWIAGVGSASTAKACAALAVAARVYKKFDPAFAARAEKQPAPPGIF